jgi:hypothetical protein
MVFGTDPKGTQTIQDGSPSTTIVEVLCAQGQLYQVTVGKRVGSLEGNVFEELPSFIVGLELHAGADPSIHLCRGSAGIVDIPTSHRGCYRGRSNAGTVHREYVTGKELLQLGIVDGWPGTSWPMKCGLFVDNANPCTGICIGQGYIVAPTVFVGF